MAQETASDEAATLHWEPLKRLGAENREMFPRNILYFQLAVFVIITLDP